MQVKRILYTNSYSTGDVESLFLIRMPFCGDRGDCTPKRCGDPPSGHKQTHRQSLSKRREDFGTTHPFRGDQTNGLLCETDETNDGWALEETTRGGSSWGHYSIYCLCKAVDNHARFKPFSLSKWPFIEPPPVWIDGLVGLRSPPLLLGPQKRKGAHNSLARQVHKARGECPR